MKQTESVELPSRANSMKKSVIYQRLQTKAASFELNREGARVLR
jgi:hypothetical protein